MATPILQNGNKQVPLSAEKREHLTTLQHEIVDTAATAAKMAIKAGLTAACAAGGVAGGTAAGGAGGAVVGAAGGAMFSVKALYPHVDKVVDASAEVAKDGADASIDASEKSIAKMESCAGSCFH